MSIIGRMNQPEMPPYPNNDNERLDLIFKFFFRQNPLQHHLFHQIIKDYYRWNIDEDEINRLENKVVRSGFITTHKQQLLQMLELNTFGREMIGDYGSYSKYQETLQEKNQTNEQRENLKTRNDELTNELLTWQNSNKEKDDLLQDLQGKLTKAQLHEIKWKRIWGIVGFVGGAIVTFSLEHYKGILKLLKTLLHI
jgi:hypothetical protein